VVDDDRSLNLRGDFGQVGECLLSVHAESIRRSLAMPTPEAVAAAAMAVGAILPRHASA
jgi:hypothetical protein